MIGYGKLKNLTDNDLFVEWCYWNNEIATATSWGSGVAVADEFRRDCEREARRRGLPWAPARVS